MITFIPLEHPAYPSTATLEAEDRADANLARQLAAEDAVRKLMTRTADDLDHLFHQMPLGVRIYGWDAPHILSMLRRDFCNFRETTMEEAMEAIEP